MCIIKPDDSKTHIVFLWDMNHLSTVKYLAFVTTKCFTTSGFYFWHHFLTKRIFVFLSSSQVHKKHTLYFKHPKGRSLVQIRKWEEAYRLTEISFKSHVLEVVTFLVTRIFEASFLTSIILSIKIEKITQNDFKEFSF